MKTITKENSKRDYLNNFIQDLEEEKVNKIYQLLKLFTYKMLCKNELLKFMEIDKNGKIDTALPMEYTNRIQEIHPNFKTQFHVFDYRENNFGELTNIAEEFIIYLQKFLSK